MDNTIDTITTQRDNTHDIIIETMGINFRHIQEIMTNMGMHRGTKTETMRDTNTELVIETMTDIITEVDTIQTILILYSEVCK